MIPVVGGIISGGITFASMQPMGIRLQKTLEKSHFDYTESDFKNDWSNVIEVCAEDVTVNSEDSDESTDILLEQINKARKMLDNGYISEIEYSAIKSKLISGK